MAVSKSDIVVRLAAFLLSLAASGEGLMQTRLAQTPPMGWMSWQAFRCNVNCAAQPSHCVNEALYVEMGQRLAKDGYLAAGYSFVSIDDCWADKNGTGRDPETGIIRADPLRFPRGLGYISNSLRSNKVTFGLYYDIGTETCAKYAGTAGHIDTDVQALVDWGVGYIKVDGCNVQNNNYERDYTLFGHTLRSKSDIVYSCSWPAYVHPKGDVEEGKPYQKMIDAECNLWRNWHDVECNWNSLRSIIDHYGDNSKFLATVAGPGHWNDMDMLLVGETCITHDEARIQMAIWSIMASPLIMGNDLRTVDEENRETLLNKDAIAVSQDPLGKPGYRLSSKGDAEVWFRQLQHKDMAIVLLNKGTVQTNVTLQLSQLPTLRPGNVDEISCQGRDIFAKKDLGKLQRQITSSLKPHSCLFVRLRCSAARPNQRVKELA